MFKSFKLSVIAATLALGTVATPVLAEGFLAGLARDAGIINEQQRRALDGAHDAAGRPLDRMANQAAGAAADYFVPGSGQVVTGALEARDRFNRMPQPQNPGYRANPNPNYPMGNGYQPVYQPQPVQMGSACYTQMGVIRGPQFFGPVGTPCWFPTPYGQVNGQIGS